MSGSRHPIGGTGMEARLTAAEIDLRLANDLTSDEAPRVAQPLEGRDAARSPKSLPDGPLADGGSDPVVASGDQMIDGLLYDLKWDVTDLDYSFPTSGGQYEDPYGEGEPTNGFATLTAGQKAAV